MQLGSVADVVTALTAIGALLAAVFGAKNAARLFGIEAKRDATAAAREVQSQASKAFAWVATRISQREFYGVVIVNSSEQAIYDVEVRVTGADEVERTPVRLTILPPGAYHLEESPQAYGWTFASRLRSFDEEIRPVTKSRKRRIVGMSFRDSSNVAWVRDTEGLLARA